ncbi:MAG TPA: DUF389 domain-containing protein [Actinomycetota bacterium]|nr:DUF389 domain-containing protein [Actinomycetota bacterium]
MLRGASVQPEGDVVSVEATNNATLSLVRRMLNDELGNVSIQTQAPKSIISSNAFRSLDAEGNDALWEEIALYIGAQSNPSANYFAAMALAGAIAAVGLWTDTLHLVVGAMVLAPGFHPVLRIALGYVAGPRTTTRPGYVSGVGGYGAMALAALLAALALKLLAPDASDDLSTNHWVRYWSTITASGIFVSALAAAAGAFVVAADRGVLAAGAMIALALVPGATIAGMGLAVGDPALAGRGALRWAVDVALVALVGGLILGSKRAVVHRRRVDAR